MPLTHKDTASGISFFNYLDAITKGEVQELTIPNLNTLLTTQFGDNRNYWTTHSGYTNLRFDYPNETKTGTIDANFYVEQARLHCPPSDFFYSFGIYTGGVGDNQRILNFETSKRRNPSTGVVPDKVFATICDTGIALVSFVGNLTSTLGTPWGCGFIGWASAGYTGSQYPRNMVAYGNAGYGNMAIGVGKRILQEATSSGVTDLEIVGGSTINASVDCIVTTSGADTIEIYPRDDASPNASLGKFPTIILQAPSGLTIGGIYTNTGIDPDGCTINTWMCIGTYGSKSLLMRVKADGYA